MYYDLYLDLFFLENFMIDSMLLILENRLLKCGRSVGRLLIGGGIGSILTCLIIISPVPKLFRIFFLYIGNSIVMILISFGKNKGKKGTILFFKRFLFLYLLSIMLGGILHLFRPYIRVLSIYYFLVCVSYFLVLGIWNWIGGLYRKNQLILQVTLYTENGEITVTGFWDTGNELRDFITMEPVNVLDPKIAGKLTEAPELEKGFHFIPYKCVGGDHIMKAFHIEKMCVHMDEDLWIQKPVVAISERSISEQKEYDMLINPGILTH